MKTLTVIGTITKDIIHFRNEVRESFGGSPWFAVEISKELKTPISIVTNVGKDFPLNKIPDDILSLSKVDTVNEVTTTLDIFSDEKNVPAIAKSFTGRIKNIDSLEGGVVIISTLFQEIRPKSIKKLRDKFDTIILDIQGFTRPSFTKDMCLSDDIKTQPENLEDVCRTVDILKCSENELDVLFEKQSIQNKFKMLHDWGVKNVIMTKGEKGCLLSTNSLVTEFQARTIKNASTVGAGDKFLILVGTFLVADNSLPKSIELAQRELERMMEENL
jgi:sugar/nucleoside kinase (ribokinase family)